jgi:endonuclease-8
MPEGDFVRRVANRLTAALAGQRLTFSLLRWPTLGGVDLTGRTVTSVDTYGKHLLTRLDDGRTLRTHLRMDGTYYIERATAGQPGPASRAGRWSSRLVLANQRWVAIGHLLGMMDLVPTRDVGRLIGDLGPDVMAPDFDADSAGQRLSAQGDRPIGEVLLDQRVVAGIGTIYLAETLFAWRVRPDRPARQVPDPAGLLNQARHLLLRSVAARTGTATGDTRRGHTTLVHGRAGSPCRRCRTPIAVMAVGHPPYQRPGFYCPTCQPD